MRSRNPGQGRGFFFGGSDHNPGLLQQVAVLPSGKAFRLAPASALSPTCMQIFELSGLAALSEAATGVGLNPTQVKGRPMRSTQQFSITLPNEMADSVRAKVASGEYATESEVIRDGLRALLARDKAMDAWLREQVIPAARALEADPAQALSPEQAQERLTSRRRARNVPNPV